MAATVAPGTIVEILRRRADQLPNRLAYSFLSDGENEESRLTFAELDLRARAIGAWLSSTAAFGDRVLLLSSSGPEFMSSFFGCLYGGVIAVPAYPLDPFRLHRTASRLLGIVKDAQPVIALTTTSSLKVANELMQAYPELSSIHWNATADISPGLAADWTCPAIQAETLAILQYTSGSTAAPKGVMLNHRNVLENERMIQEAHCYSDTNTFVGWIPLAHDWGLINNVLQPLFLGATSIIMPTEAFLHKPARWLQAISRYTNVTSGGPSFAYELCVSKVNDEDRYSLKLENWVYAGIGASPVRPSTLDRFASRFSSCGFRRKAFYCGYGLAEATLLVSDSERSQEPRVLRVQKTALEQHHVRLNPHEDAPASFLVGCGRVPSTERVAIVDPQTCTVCPLGSVGEIWVAGGNVAQGYWNNPTETQNTFRAFLKDSQEGPFLRTGDLGFFDEGELFVTGRLKDLIIIRGRNLYPEDIESTVERCHEALRPGCTVAFSIQADFDERLIIVQEVRSSQQTKLDEIITTIRQAIFREHEVAAYGILLAAERSIPKTSSGKLQRQACRSAYLSGGLNIIEKSIQDADRIEHGGVRDYLAPRTRVEHELARIWAEVLSIEVEKIGIHDRFFDVGGDSLAAVECSVKIREAFGHEQFSPEIFLYATLAQMAEAVSAPAWFAERVRDVLPFQPDGNGVPLVLVFPGTECQSLVRHLGANRPLLGIRSTLVEQMPAPLTIEQVASECVVRLRRHLPHGPYALGGWCASGIVALEMARQLEQSGDQVAFVALIDARVGFLPPLNPALRSMVRVWRFTQRSAFFASKVRRRGMKLLWQRAAEWHVTIRQRARRIQGDPKSQSDDVARALQRYKPKPWAGRILHLWAAERPTGKFRSPEFVCGCLSSDGFVFREVPGDHMSMLEEPNVGLLVDILASELDQFPHSRA